jgi:6-phosphofructokinase
MRVGILTGGGDVAPLNAVISGLITQCVKTSTELVGFIKGWEGILNDHWRKLNDIKLNPEIGGTILKSSRVNLKKIDCGPEKVLSNLKRNHIDGLIVIGGEDTLANALCIKNFPKVLISKTIDNDVGQYREGIFVNHFTLGHPTAAEKISGFVSLEEGMRTTAYSHDRIIVVESMGMHAGWLALSSCQGHPDFIIIPEFPLDFGKFIEKVISRFTVQKNLMIVISEGARWNSGEYISADINETDSFGHPRFKGTAEVLARKLRDALSPYFNTRNINSVNPSYLYRSGKPNHTDLKMAISHLKSSDCTVFLTAESNRKSTFTIGKYEFNMLDNIEEFHRFVDESLYNHQEYYPTELYQSYISGIIPELSSYDYGI